jgi:hypothetical protein
MWLLEYWSTAELAGLLLRVGHPVPGEALIRYHMYMYIHVPWINEGFDATVVDC